MHINELIIRPMLAKDLPGAMRLSINQGWNQTEVDWKWIIQNTTNRCLLAEYQGKIIGTTAAMNYDNEVAWINMVLVDAAYRGHGISKVLLQTMFEQLVSCASIKLDATPEGQKVYSQFGFIDEYSIVRMTRDLNDPPSLKKEEDDLIEPIHHHHLPEIITFDQRVFGASRASLIEALVTEYPQQAWMLKRNQEVCGFALGRAGRRYQQIGPVAASSWEEAKALITKSVAHAAGKSLVVDVLSDKPDLISWLFQMGFTTQRHFIRMYRHHNPFPGNSNQQYLIGGPEFG